MYETFKKKDLLWENMLLLQKFLKNFGSTNVYLSWNFHYICMYVYIYIYIYTVFPPLYTLETFKIDLEGMVLI